MVATRVAILPQKGVRERVAVAGLYGKITATSGGVSSAHQGGGRGRGYVHGCLSLFFPFFFRVVRIQSL